MLRAYSVSQHMAFGEPARQLLRGHARAADVADQDVGLRFTWIYLGSRNLRQPFSEETSVGVVPLQCLRPLIKRNQPGCCKNARLPHAPSECFAIDAAPVH